MTINNAEYLLSIGEQDEAKKLIFIELTDGTGQVIKETVIAGFPVYTPSLCIGVIGLENAKNLFDRFAESMSMFGGRAF